MNPSQPDNICSFFDGGLRITLPWPPSINHYYRNVGSRTLISREGRTFRRHVCGLLSEHGSAHLPIEGRLAVSILVFPPDRRRRDIDNIQKPVLDALQHAGMYRDDSQIDLLITRRGDIIPGGRLEIEVLDMPVRTCPLCDRPGAAITVTWAEQCAGEAHE